MTNEDAGQLVPVGPVAAADIRVSNVEREHAAAVLQDAMDQGMITLDEYGERTAIALAARTRGELGVVLADLPTAQTAAHPAVTDQPLELRTGMGDVKQTGHWTVPSRINARCSMGNVKIDFTDAVCNHRQVELHAECGWGNITVIVPRGWTVVIGSTSVGSGNLSNKATDPGLPGYPVLVVSGSVTAGNIKIKYPRR